MMKSS